MISTNSLQDSATEMRDYLRTEIETAITEWIIGKNVEHDYKCKYATIHNHEQMA